MKQSALPTLIQKCKKRDRRAQKALYEYCFSYLMRIAFRYLSRRDDAAQLVNQAFLKVLLQLDQYDPERPFLPWAGQITVRCAIDHYRQNIRRQETFLDPDLSAHAEALQIPPQVLDQLAWEDLQKIISQLPATQRVVFNLKEWEGYSHQEIAAELNCSERSSKRYLEAAKQKLKALLKESYHLKIVI